MLPTVPGEVMISTLDGNEVRIKRGRTVRKFRRSRRVRGTAQSVKIRQETGEKPIESSAAMLISGIGYLIVYPCMIFLEVPGWIWGEPRRMPAFEYMLLAMYIPLGAFLVWGARDPLRYRPMVDYTVASNLVHGTVMLCFALSDATEHEHLGVLGDVVGTYAAPLILLAGHPAIATARRRRRHCAPSP
ncbi:DUF6632 domain-containing protein [Streptomyces sp. NPDC056470]|uniref:DUF6632 domain-containing protein n=1 Tax=Streptomyces sp. NPDC056470 TaxID=3345831 RepID=UPI00368DAA69